MLCFCDNAQVTNILQSACYLVVIVIKIYTNKKLLFV